MLVKFDIHPDRVGAGAVVGIFRIPDEQTRSHKVATRESLVSLGMVAYLNHV